MNSPDLLDRLYERLVESLRDRPRGANPTVTIAEVYQSLIPYRAVRTELGILELAEYEHALLRLLAGERGYAVVELPQVTEELQRELATTNPILGIYRDYAAVELRVAVNGGSAAAAESAGSFHAPMAPSAADVASTALDTGLATTERAPDEASPHHPPVEPATAADVLSTSLDGAMEEPAANTGGGRADALGDETQPDAGRGNRRGTVHACTGCGSQLPEDDDVRYCPSCGTAHDASPCVRCGGQMRAEWNFCIRCGTQRPSAFR